MEFDFKEIEKNAKDFWAKNEVYKVTEDPSRLKFYVLDMFPYPSGAGLHVGHPLGYVASDIFARYKRLKGFNVLHPMGYDAFGLPAEQYALETGTHPAITTESAIARYRQQLDKIGFSFDWSRSVRTSDPSYYKWTQWIFLKLYGSWYNRENNKAEPVETLIEKLNSSSEKIGKNKSWKELSASEQDEILMNHRLAYLSYAEVNWCEQLGCVLANDEVKDGKSERGGYPVEKRKMRQWFLRITEYSDRLLEGLERIDWSESLKEQQRYWIGRSEGALVHFPVVGEVTSTYESSNPLVLGPVHFHTIDNPQTHQPSNSVTVFTTRPDTIFGATFLVLAPEHELVKEITTAAQKSAVEEYVAYVKSKSDVERQQEKKVTGVFTGAYAVNPFTEKRIPIWLAEYVLAGYGTGAIMAVPAGDERDKKFAEKFGLEIGEIIDRSRHADAGVEDKVGTMVNSGLLNGLEVKMAISKILEEVERRGIGERKVNYKQRDAIYSRQRYWGEPIPVKFKEILTPLPESALPLLLPEVSSYKPTGDGRSPLAHNEEWVKNGYETDTMPGYAGSSWYFLRYVDPHNENEFASKEKLDYWQNVDLYLGGSEHAVGHLLYARFWTKFLFDLGYVPFDEPFKKLVNQGMIGGKSGIIYRLSILHVSLGFEEEIYISAEVYNRWQKSDFSQIIEELNAKYHLNIDLNFDRNHDPKIKSPEPEYFYSRIHVPIQFISTESEENEIDEARFVQYRQQLNERAIFIKDGETFRCFRELEKMSKSKHNVINPDDVIDKHGADCFRMFEMFLGPIEQSKPWDDKGINGVSNFIRKFWRLFYDEGKQKWNDDAPANAELKILHKLLKKVESDIERLSFNTCVSAFMIAVNELSSLNCNKKKILQPMLQALAPFAPFVTEELWKQLGNPGSIHHSKFPEVEEKYLVESVFNYPVSINGKVRANIELPLDMNEEELKKTILENEVISKWTNGSEPKKFVFVKGRIINLVV